MSDLVKVYVNRKKGEKGKNVNSPVAGFFMECTHFCSHFTRAKWRLFAR